ncbi:hypothetical protein GF373_06385, partial [bacterium]|nr:hypothetical protein [bacterium]
MKISQQTLSFIVFLGLIFSCLGLTDVTQVLYAQDDQQEEEIVPDGIPPLSKRVSLLDVPVSVYPLNRSGSVPDIKFQELYEIKIMLEDKTPNRPGLDLEDFLPLTNSALTSGISLFKESGSQTGFNYSADSQSSDIPVNLREAPIIERDEDNGIIMITFRPQIGGFSTQLNVFFDQFPDFYIVGQTSLNLLQGDRFEASIPENGITISQKNNPLQQYTLYPDRFPSDYFLDVNPEFAVPAVFEGDIIQILSTVQETDNSNRIDISSEPRSVLGFDLIGREDKEYFVKEVKVNFYGVSLQALAPLMKQWSPSGFFPNPIETPTFFLSPYFYNRPENEFGELLTQTTVSEAETTLTMPLDWATGDPNPTFMMGMDNLQSHVTSYVSFGPRKPFADLQFPRIFSPDIFESFSASKLGGIFLFRELGGTKGQYDPGVDHLIKLDEANFRIEPLAIAPEEVQLVTSPHRNLLRRLMPSNPGGVVSSLLPFLFEDSNLGEQLFGITPDVLPVEAEEPRPPLGSLECYDDPDCFFFDQLINIEKPFLGLTEGQVRYLTAFTGENGKTNAEELFGFPMVYGFTFVLPVARDNAMTDLLAPNSRTGDAAGADIYVGIKTSENMRNLDSFIPFIQPMDVVVGSNASGFTQGATQGVDDFQSVSSIGLGRKNTRKTTALIGRPRPRVGFTDLTQPTENHPGNNNILFDRSLGSPVKPVIGINLIDFGQNANLMENPAGYNTTTLDNFFTESTVLGEMIIEILPGQLSALNPLIFAPIPQELGISLSGSGISSSHSIAMYADDDTPPGDLIDNDQDGLIDEEIYNLMDDDGDGLIDEDLGDGDEAGENGVFDENDDMLPFYQDAINFSGVSASFDQAQYLFPPNDQAQYEGYFELIIDEDADVEYGDGSILPLTEGGTWFAELDFRVLNYESWSTLRPAIFPLQFNRTLTFDPTPAPDYGAVRYNMGTYPALDGFPGTEPKVDLIDFVSILRGMGGDFEVFPYMPEDLFIEVDGAPQWMLTLASEDNTIPLIADPDGDPYRSFALSMVHALRVPDPSLGFIRVGRVPMVVQVTDDEGGEVGQDPQGENIGTDAGDDPYTQFGIFIELDGDINDYIENNLFDPLTEAYENAREAITEYNEELEASQGEDGGDPPDAPDVVEVNITDPYEALGLNGFLGGDEGDIDYETNYMYELQLPDENFGPLKGDDYFITVRASDEAEVNDSFRMRISSGRRSSEFTEVDPQSGDVQEAIQPGRGISYHSFMETEYEEFFPNVFRSQITTNPIVVRSANVAPEFRFISPGTGQNIANAEFEFQISFEAEDPDNVAEIQLFVDDNNQDFDGTFIPGALLQEGFSTGFTMNMREDIPNFDPTQSYYIYARIDDKVNDPVYVYASSAVTTIAGAQGGGGTGGGSQTIVVHGDLTNQMDYIKLSGDGRVFNLGEAPNFPTAETTGRAVDMEVTDLFSGQLILQEDGRIVAAGDIGPFQTKLQPNGEILFDEENVAFYKNSTAGGELIVGPTAGQMTIEHARDIEVDWDNAAIYVLDGDGDMVFYGAEANRNLVPEGLGLDLYRDMELTPDGGTLYFLSGNGMLFEVGNGTSIGTWSDLTQDDIYRDMELLTNEQAVTGILITDDSGNRVAVGSAGDNLASLPLPTEIEPGTVRQVKLFPGREDILALMEGSGQVHILAEPDVEIPDTIDQFQFADQPGLDDDRIVDMETTAVDLQSVVASVNAILEGFQGEMSSKVMPLVSPDYKARSGADSAGLKQALESMFEFYEIRSFAKSTRVDNPFTITNQGDIVTASVTYDFYGWYPYLEATTVEAEADGETAASVEAHLYPIFADQNISIRKIHDGRGWNVEFWKINNLGREFE